MRDSVLIYVRRGVRLGTVIAAVAVTVLVAAAASPGQGRAHRAAAASAVSKVYATDFVGIYNATFYSTTTIGDKSIDLYNYTWAEVTTYRCGGVFRGYCASATSLSAHGTIYEFCQNAPDRVDPACNGAHECTISSNPRLAVGQGVPGPPPELQWLVPDSADPALGLQVTGDCTYARTVNPAGFLPGWGVEGSFAGCSGSTDVTFVPLVVTDLFADAYSGGPERVSDAALPLNLHQGDTIGCQTQDPKSTEFDVWQVSIDSNVFMRRIAEGQNELGSFNKIGQLLMWDAVALLNGGAVPPQSGQPVYMPDPGPGQFTADCYGKLLSGHERDLPGGGSARAAAAGQRGELIATAAAHLHGHSPFAYIRLKPTPQASQLITLTGSHGPIQLTAVVTFRPAGSHKTFRRTVTRTLPATPF